MGVCPHCNIELKVEASLADISFNILKGELNTGVLADAFGDFTDTEKNTCEEEDGGNKEPAEGKSGVTQGFFASELMCSLFQGSERAIKTLVEKSVAPFTGYEHYTREEIAELDATLFNRITSARGGLDANGDGVGDMVFPHRIPNQLLTVTTTGDIYETRQYFIELRNQQELKEAGWDIRPLRSDNNQYKIEDAPALSVNKTSWVVTTTEDAPSPVEAEFVLVHDGIGPLADETSFFNPMLYKDRTLSDLAIEVTGSPAEVSLAAGTTIDYTATITNRGKDQATGVTLRAVDLLGEGLVLTGASTPHQGLDCAQEIAAGIICHLGALDFGDSLEVTLQYELAVCREELLECATGVELETITTSFSVESDVEDHALENNSWVVTTKVRESPDRAALVALYNAMGGANWTQQRYWLSGKPVGDWYGVTTDVAGRVTGLDLYYVGLNGPLPAVVGDLTYLQELSIAQNPGLSGSLPPKLFKLTNLRRLSITGSQLTGALPAELGNLTDLQELYLYENDLGGQIPVELAGLSKLEHLYLSGNDFEGCLPEGLADVADNDLETLALPDCTPTTVQPKPDTDKTAQKPVSGDAKTDRDALVVLYNLTGGATSWDNRGNWLSEAPIREWHGVATDASGRVTSLNLHRNGLRGGIPPELGNLTGLTGLNLSRNGLSGDIPPELGNLTGLTSLNLSQNGLSGDIPPELGDLTGLTSLNLSQNGLSESIPPELGSLTSLTGLSLNQNRLSGGIPAELGGLTSLRSLNLSSNKLSGGIPAELGGLTSLTSLDLRSNELSGELGGLTGLTQQLVSLTHLHLSGNHQLGGCSPRLQDVPINDFSQLGLSFCPVSGDAKTDRDALVVLYNLTGGATSWDNRGNWLSEAPIREWHGVATDASGRVTSLNLHRNGLRGGIPPELGNLTGLTGLNLSRNGLSGDIPPELGNLTGLTSLNLSQNGLSGDIPPELGDLTGLTSLNLSQNGLSESIPPELGSLTSLTGLSLNQNRLSGGIPAELGGLTSLRSLNLSSNKLSGGIPAELGGLTSLTSLDLRSNELSGELGGLTGLTQQLVSLTHLHLSGNHQLGGCSPRLQDVPINDFSQLGLSFCPVSGDAKTDRDALVVLYNLTGGATSWDNRGNWLSEAPIREWHGVATDASGRVTSLNLHRNGLRGGIPPELGNLTGLTGLNLSRNGLSGDIPPELGNLTGLTSLNLSQNGLSGDIPPELGDLTGLTSLNLSQNGLSESIPPELGSLTSLTGLSLNQNRLSGGIPAELGGLTSLRSLNLSSNKLSGGIPAELGGLTSLTSLDLRSNELSGELGGLTGLTQQLVSLTHLHLSGNHQLGGCSPRLQDVPINDFSQLGLSFCPVSGDAKTDRDALVVLYNLTGGATSWDNRGNWLSEAPIREWHGVATDASGRVTSLNLHRNGLRGGIPPELGNLTGLTGLNLSRNGLSGDIPPELGNLTGLTSLNLSQNGLSGDIPPELGDLTGLTSLNLSQNGLSESIPPELGSLTSLTGLSLNQNRLSGGIPAELGGLTSLRSLNLSSNKLSGGIPAELGGLTSLTSLDLRSNELSGELGGLTGLTQQLVSLTHLHLSGNHQLGGCSPRLQDVPINDFSQLGLSFCPVSGDAKTDRDALVVLYNLTGGATSWDNRGNWLSEAPIREWHGVATDASGRVTSLNLHRNGLRGGIPPELGNLTGLTGLNLSRNGLSGDIPPELGNLTGLTSLNLSQNGLSGDIPPELGDLTGLTSLNLSQNGLSESIPPELGSLTSLTGLSLNQNRLSGGIPAGVGRSDQPEVTEPLIQQVERRHTGGAGRPDQSDIAGPPK